MKPDTNSCWGSWHLQQSHNGQPVDSALVDAALLRRNCHTIESHHGHPLDGTLVGAGWVWPSVVPHGVIMGIQWMVGWTAGFLCPLPHLLYPLWLDWPRHLFRELHNRIQTFVVPRKSDAWLGPIIFLLQTRANISLVASTTALV